MRICLVIPSLQAGGMERVMSELAWHFSKKKNTDLHLIMYGIKRDIFYPIPETMKIHTPSFLFNNKYRFYYTLKTLVFLRKKIKKLNPDVLLSFGEYWNNFFLLSTLGLEFPRYVSDRSQPDKSLGRFQDFLRRRLYPRSTGLILQTEKAREIYLEKNRHSNIAVIGNPVKDFGRLNNHLKKEKNILTIGRLINTKQHDKLIEMFSEIREPGWNLLIVGYDHLKQKNMQRLKQLAKDLMVEKNVSFLGKQENISEIYNTSAVFAFTSISEGFPNVIGEAMTAGLPVVAFDCIAGPSEMIIDGYNGFLIPLFDFDEFRSKLSLLLKDEKLRIELGANAKKSIQKFSGEKVCEKYYQFITSEYMKYRETQKTNYQE